MAPKTTPKPTTARGAGKSQPAKPAVRSSAKPAARGAAKPSVPAIRPRAGALAKQTDLDALMEADIGAGLEGATREAFAIPFLKVLQDGSPQCKKGQPGYNPNAAPGMLFNTVTGELINGDDGIIFIPCAFQWRYIQWGPRGSEGGYRGEHLPEDVTENLNAGVFVRGDDGVIYVGEPNPKKSDRIMDTRNHFGLILSEDGTIQQSLLSLSSTQIKKSKQLMGLLSAVRRNGKLPPTWMNKIRITTQTESNDKGSWYGIRIESAGFIDDEENGAAIYDKGKAFHDVIAAGQARVNYNEVDGTGDVDGEDGEAEKF